MSKRRISAIALLAAFWLAPAAAQQAPSPGKYAAIAADCLVCHSMPGGRPFAGGLKMSTPGGALYSTNITPDPETGIGKYAYEDFEKALRKGLRKDGARLYPAMPYPSYVKLSDADTRALYEYFMKEVAPVRQTNTANEISGVTAIRSGLALWNLVGAGNPFRPNADFDAEWNRGAYLVQGPGHCGACHTPRGLAFQEKALEEKSGAYLTGGVLDNWSAPNLRGDLNTGLGRWSEAEIADYLKKGANRFGAAFGAMREVVTYSTSQMNDADIKAIAKYLKSLSPSVDRAAPVWVYNSSTAEALGARRYDQPGAATYQRQCASCHGADGAGGGSLPALAGNPAVLDPDAASLVNIVLNGAQPTDSSEPGDFDWMPQFRSFLSDKEVADVVTFIRSGWGNRAPPATPEKVGRIRTGTANDDRTPPPHMR